MPKQSRQVATGVTWAIAARVADRLIGFVSIAALARLLTPTDFGLVAMAGSVVAFIELLNAFGFDWALVRHPSPTEVHYNTAWTLRLVLGLATAVILLAISPFAAAFYRQPPVQPLLAVMALSSLIGSLENIGTVDFRRHFSFDKEFVLRTCPKVISFLVALCIAVFLRSYWALVVGSLVSRIAGTVLSYTMHPFRPRPSVKAAPELLSFSAWLLATNVVEFARNRFADFLVGRVFGPRSTGLYSVANEIAHLSTTEVAAPINRVAFSMYAKNAATPGAIQDSFVQVASVIWMVALPMAAGTIATSHELVALMLGPQWSDTATILSLLALGGGLSVMMANTHYVYWAMGRAKLVAALSLFGFLTMAAASLAFIPIWGLPGVAIGYVAATAITVPLNYFLLWKTVGIVFWGLWSGVWRSFVAAVAMFCVLMAAFTAPPATTALAAIGPFIAKVGVGAAIYFACLWLLWRCTGRPEGAERAVYTFVVSRFRRIPTPKHD
jgi:lipopolysaccharide exporter